MATRSSSSVARNVYAETWKEKIVDLNLSNKPTDGASLAASSECVVACWEAGGGGTVSVIAIDQCGKRDPEHTCVRGHKGPVQDIQICPFYDSIFATSSEDGTIKLWDVPLPRHGEIRKDSVATLHGHDKRVCFSAFNHVAEWILASGGIDGTVKVWDLELQEIVTSLTLPQYSLSLRWNDAGTLLATTTRAKTLHVIDPRQKKLNPGILVHEGAKPLKCDWAGGPRAGSDSYVVTCGFSKVADRECALWDIRMNTATPVKKITFDRQSSIVQPFADPATGLVVLCGKGDGNIHFFDVVNGDLNRIGTYATGDPGRDTAFAPKRVVDVMKCEVLRAFKVIGTGVIQPMSIIIPRRNMSEFQADLFLPCYNGDAALSAAEWRQGKDAPPIVQSMEPVDGHNPFVMNKRPANCGKLSFGLERQVTAVNRAPSVLHKRLTLTAQQSDQYSARIEALEMLLKEKEEEVRRQKQEIQEKDREISVKTQSLLALEAAQRHPNALEVKSVNRASGFSSSVGSSSVTRGHQSGGMSESMELELEAFKTTAKEATSELRRLCEEAHLTTAQLDMIKNIQNQLITNQSSTPMASPMVGTLATPSIRAAADTATIVEVLLKRLAKLEKRCKDLGRRNEALESVYAQLRASIEKSRSSK